MMPAAAPAVSETKAPRRRASKPAKTEAAKLEKVTVYLTPKTAEIVRIEAAMTKSTQSAVVEKAIRRVPQRFVVTDRDKAEAGRGEKADLAADVENIGSEGE
jgi:hypothetical protein